MPAELQEGKRQSLGVPAMTTVKEKMAEVIQAQPEDASYEEIMRELAFERMVQRGLVDSRQGKTLENEEAARRIHSWRK